jgi:hypothetical protein
VGQAELRTVLLPPPRIGLPWRALRDIEQVSEKGNAARPRWVSQLPAAARAVGMENAEDVCEKGERGKVKHEMLKGKRERHFAKGKEGEVSSSVIAGTSTGASELRLGRGMPSSRLGTVACVVVPEISLQSTGLIRPILGHAALNPET